MAEPWDTLRFNFVSRVTAYYVIWGQAYDEMYDLYQDLATEGNPQSSQEAYSLSLKFNAIRAKWGGGTSTVPGRLLQCLDYLNENIGGGEVTMDSILTAMMTATPEQVTKFMGITQAYKVAVWESPFNEEFYAALARGFKIWGP
ncbi:hypothetical protein LCGC14_1095220 [marine sediment metagenome]|uniref:Uncharacterized protein n=1 Tax=marine sediment metagenome TaxID=412755 RepID=A0A0F9MFH4_9ZZZZ